MTRHTPIKLALFVLPALLLVAVALLIWLPRPPAPQTPEPIPTWLSANSETRVELVEGSPTRVYGFSAASPTRFKLDSITPGFAFAAVIRDAAGETVAAFDNSLQQVQFTLAPQSAYVIALTPADPKRAGTLSLALGDAILAPETADGTAYRAVDCRVGNVVGVAALIRSAPAERYAIIGLLPPEASVSAIGRTDNGWYTVNWNERQGWVKGDVVALAGDCAALPFVHNPAIAEAPADPQAMVMQVDRDGSGKLRQAISTPGGDTRDLIWTRVINLHSEPPNNYREFALTLRCGGDGAEHLRWGSAYSPTLHCGESLALPFLNTDAQHPIAVEFAAGSPQSYVEYDLILEQAAAAG